MRYLHATVRKSGSDESQSSLMICRNSWRVGNIFDIFWHQKEGSGRFSFQNPRTNIRKDAKGIFRTLATYQSLNCEGHVKVLSFPETDFVFAVWSLVFEDNSSGISEACVWKLFSGGAKCIKLYFDCVSVTCDS